MALLSLRDITFGFGSPPILEGVELHIERGERVGLLGRNGAGKSTLMKLMMGELRPDHGTVDRQAGVRVARLIQEVPSGRTGTIFDEVAAGLGPEGIAVAAQYHLHHPEADLSEAERKSLEKAAESLNHDIGWQLEHRIEQMLERMQLDPLTRFDTLSSGMKRRVLLGQSLVSDPDILLLDEPTNHLDLDAIRWLEEFLMKFGGTFLFVTHDRMFLQRLANRIIELDRGRLFDWPCDYGTFLERKEAALAAEEQQQALFDKKLAVEEAWIRRGVKARRVRNEGRVRALKKLREERKARREKVGTVKVELQEAERSGALVVDTKDLTYEIGGRTIIRQLTTTVMRGDKIGIIGTNGAGKTTLIRLLLGELNPTSGRVKRGTNLEVAYFDQLRAQLDEEKSVKDNVSEGKDQLLINGQQRHIIGYLEDFLFTPERSRGPARYLSGGERNRLLLARLFSKPSNVLVLDEPTNDLDTETLDLLEDLIVEYPGTVLLVSHDRTFLNNVVTNTLVFEGDGHVREYAGGYDDWLDQRARQIEIVPESKSREVSSPSGKPATSNDGPRRRTFKEQQELATLTRRIDALETEQRKLHDEMASPDFYQQDKLVIASATKRSGEIEEELMNSLERWEVLEALAE
ncbi:ATP-binding cassette domain-containing protein [Schlesneria paludicola]|uniref:ATP-binding cassette domain-containing protein n=1 Tax=Schlesneria paludicola TaxID=360056 RepID=UPI00029AD377|nr:ATP-binding cassette domain-containing protein [Schlesneria paludicola]